MKRLALTILTTGILFWGPSCQRHRNNNEEPNPKTPPAPTVPSAIEKRDVALTEISDGKCLNLEKFFSAVLSLTPAPKFRSVTTDLNISSEKPVSHNFLLRLVYGGF